jgi:SulP family sulfate permease
LLAADTFWSDKGLVLIKDKYGSIPTFDFLVYQPVLPALEWSGTFFGILCRGNLFCGGRGEFALPRMADRLAGNTGVPYNPNKEPGTRPVNMITL